MRRGEAYIGARVEYREEGTSGTGAFGTIVGFGEGLAPSGFDRDGTIIVEWDGGTTACEYPSDLALWDEMDELRARGLIGGAA